MRQIVKEQDTHVKVMILDDDEIVVEGLCTFLIKNGYIAEGHTEVEKAIKRLEEDKFDILILDFFLINTDGKKVIERIRGLDCENYDISIILLTGYANLQPPLSSLRQLDIQGYVEKGDKFNDVLIEVEKLKKSILKIRELFYRKKTLGERIKELRILNKMTQDELALILGVVRTAIVAYEQNVNEPSISKIKKMAELFKVSTDYLLNYNME